MIPYLSVLYPTEYQYERTSRLGLVTPHSFAAKVVMEIEKYKVESVALGTPPRVTSFTVRTVA